MADSRADSSPAGTIRPDPALPLHILSFLCQLQSPRGERSRLAELIGRWQAELTADSVYTLTSRQLRRWRLLDNYWREHGGELIQHGFGRGFLNPELVTALGQLSLAPPVAFELIEAVPAACTALFVTPFAWGEQHGTSQQMELRQLRYLDRFPPLHLSARVADAAILSAGNLALEALSQWLGRRLALEEDFPLWAEAAFADTVRLVDESASLAFVGAVLQRMFADPAPPDEDRRSAFSGIVRRDSGRIEPVQGFELPYGKLEAAFDAGVRELFLPRGTPLGALPQAGILLQKQTEAHYRYSFADQPDDGMQIHLLADLEELFLAACYTRLPDAVSRRLEQLPLSLGAAEAMPALAHWQAFATRLEAHLPALLLPGFTRLTRSYRQACELARAGLAASWPEVARDLHSFCTQLLWVLTDLLASLGLQTGSWQARQQLLNRLQPLRHPVPASELLALLDAPEMKQVLEQNLPLPGEQVQTLLGFIRALFAGPPDPQADAGRESLWKQIRFLIQSPALPELFQAFRLGRAQTGSSIAAAGGPVLLLAQAGTSLELPLLLTQPEGQDIWLYAGMGPDHPVYFKPATGETRALPGACPYLPERLLELRRDFTPVHRRQGDSLYYGSEPIHVALSLHNLSYLPLSLHCAEVLPAGLTLASGSPGWEGELGPQQKISFTYELAAAPAGEYVLPEPQLSFRLPPPYPAEADTGQAAGCANRLVISAHTRPELRLSRTAPETGLTREPLSLSLRLENLSSQPALQLAWRSELLPPGFSLPEAVPLPAQLGPFESYTLSCAPVARLPGTLVWPALELAYQDAAGQVYSATLPAQPLQIHFKRDLPLAGRSQELAWLDACFANPALQGICLWGERGLGKRGLLQAWQPLELCFELQGDPFLDLPLNGARALLRQLLAALRRLADPPQGPHLDLLEQFVQGSADPETDRQLKSRFFQAVLQAFAALTLRGPLLLRIYRVELLDQATLELLRFLLLNQASVFLALTGNSPELPAPIADLPLTLRRLERLETAAIEAILAEMFAPHTFGPQLAAELQARTQGVALHLQEYLAWLVQQGWIRPADAGWELSAEPGGLPLPDQLERLIVKEFQALLQPQDQGLLAAAAVLGQRFRRQELTELAAADPVRVEAFLGRALAGGLLQADAGGYGFAHPLYHELFYKQAGADVKALHALAARQGERLGAEAQSIAMHWLRADQPDVALPYCIGLGEQALRQGSFAAAAKWLQQAETLSGSHPQGENAWPGLYRALGELYRHTDRQERARASYQIYLRLAQAAASPADQARAWLGLGSLAQQAEALHCLQKGHQLAQQLQDPDLLYQASFQLGVHLAEAQSYAEAETWFEQALSGCRPDSLEQAEVLEMMGYEAIKAGHTQLAESRLLQSKLVYETQQQPQGLASVYNRLGACCFYQQELTRARHYFGESRKYCVQTGSLLKLAQVDHNLGLLAEALRDYPEAEAIFSANLKLAGQLNDLRIQGFAWNQLGSVRLKLRQLTPAAEALEQAQILLEQATDQRGLAYLRLNRGLLALLQRDPLLAAEHLGAARTSFDELGDVMGQDLALMRLGHVAWLRGQIEAAAELYSRCLAARQVLDHKQEDGLERVHHALGLVAIARQDWTQAESHLLRAEALLEKRREISHYAIACHNLMRLYQQTDRLEQALDFKQKRDILIGIDRYGISRELFQAEGLYPMLD